MPETAELSRLRQSLDQVRQCVVDMRESYGDIPAVRRLLGDVERMDLDAGDLSAVAPPSTPAAPAGSMTPLTDDPVDPALWADADDEGLGGYLRGYRP